MKAGGHSRVVLHHDSSRIRGLCAYREGEYDGITGSEMLQFNENR